MTVGKYIMVAAFVFWSCMCVVEIAGVNSRALLFVVAAVVSLIGYVELSRGG